MNIDVEEVIAFLEANHVQPMYADVLPTVYDNGETYELAVSLMVTDEETEQPVIYKELLVSVLEADRDYDELKEEWSDALISILAMM